MKRAAPNRKTAWLGAAALACFAVHATWHIVHHEAHDLLWTCNAACLVVGVAAVAGSATGVAVGLLWLSYGIPMWILDLATGGALIPTSILTHVGGAAIAALVLRETGWPERAWWKAVVAQLALVVLTRLVTPPAANVNLAFSVYAGWEHVFPSFTAYFALLFASAATTFVVVERAYARVLGK